MVNKMFNECFRPQQQWLPRVGIRRCRCTRRASRPMPRWQHAPWCSRCYIGYERHRRRNAPRYHSCQIQIWAQRWPEVLVQAPQIGIEPLLGYLGGVSMSHILLKKNVGGVPNRIFSEGLDIFLKEICVIPPCGLPSAPLWPAVISLIFITPRA